MGILARRCCVGQECPTVRNLATYFPRGVGAGLVAEAEGGSTGDVVSKGAVGAIGGRSRDGTAGMAGGIAGA